MSKTPTYVSLFAGAGGFDIGFDAAGFRCAAQVEIDKTARAVLGHHYPDVPRYDDVRNFGKKQVRRADVVVGGFPCQDVSTAGKRAGFEGGVRSSLWFEMLRVISELRPTYVVWENVPGLLSADDGRAFGWVLRGLADIGFDGGWRTVDAQYFGVPQQRRRVFGVFARGHLGTERAAEILALAESSSRRTPSRRKAGTGTAAAAEGGTESGREDATTLRASGVGTERCGDTKGQDPLVVVFGGGDTRGERGADAALTTKGERQDFDTDNFVLSVRTANTSANGIGVQEGKAFTIDRANGQAVCVTGTVTHTLTADGCDASEDGTGRGTPIMAFNPSAGGTQTTLGFSEIPGTLGVNQVPDRMPGTVVRRLMPIECERLMGWGDDWTRYRQDGSEIADGPRYRLCGNGVVGTVSRWLAMRLMTVVKRGRASE